MKYYRQISQVKCIKTFCWSLQFTFCDFFVWFFCFWKDNWTFLLRLRKFKHFWYFLTYPPVDNNTKCGFHARVFHFDKAKMILKCLVRRNLTGSRPHPGRPMAQQKLISTKLRNSPTAFLSSIDCLISLIGGWAPYSVSRRLDFLTFKRLDVYTFRRFVVSRLDVLTFSRLDLLTFRRLDFLTFRRLDFLTSRRLDFLTFRRLDV